MNTIKKTVDEKIKSAEYDINYHLEEYEKSIKRMITLTEELKEYNLDTYETKWLKASLEFTKGQKSLLKIARKK